jgi:DNA-binding transcriptional regulator GbsR (MarR family)
MQMTPSVERYVLHWGEMGQRWGVNRSVAQIHALLLVAGKPLTAEEISETLSMARSNVSTSIRELQSWNLVKVVHELGDRRDHFQAMSDLWDMFLTIVEERKRREIDPTLTTLRNCVLEGREDSRTPPEALARMEEMLKFLETMDGWYAEVRKLPRATLMSLVRLGGRIARLVRRLR